MLDHLLPDKFYFSILGYLLLVLVYAPIVLFVLVLIWKKLKINKFIKKVLAVCLLLLAIAVPFYDVYFSSLEMAQACNEKAGLHVYKKVKAESF